MTPGSQVPSCAVSLWLVSYSKCLKEGWVFSLVHLPIALADLLPLLGPNLRGYLSYASGAVHAISRCLFPTSRNVRRAASSPSTLETGPGTGRVQRIRRWPLHTPRRPLRPLLFAIHASQPPGIPAAQRAREAVAILRRQGSVSSLCLCLALGIL